jgi:hypothetical protein
MARDYRSRAFDGLLSLAVLSFILLSFFPSAKSEGVGIGINTYSIVFNGSVFDTYTVSPRVINPSDYEVKARVFFDCFNCVQNVTVFGRNIAQKVDDHNSYFRFEQDDVTIPPATTGKDGIPVYIRFSPNLILKKYLTFRAPRFTDFFVRIFNKDYNGWVKIPYFTLFIGEKHLKGLMVADVYWSSFGKMGVTPSVGATLEMTARGMPLSSFVFLLLLLVLVILIILRKKGLNFKSIKSRFRKKKATSKPKDTD